MEYEWYSDISENSDIEQGDIVERCNIIMPNERHYSAILNNDENNEPLDIKEIDGIVLSQSCDIQNEKIESIILCPIWSLKKFKEKGNYFKSSRAIEDLRRGYFPEYHLLQKFSGIEMPEDFYFVDFHRIYSVPKAFVVAILKDKPRKRLLPPYREHLSQSFARYFMRVGLPTDISVDEIKKYAS
jgi:hypothetical protein